MQFIKGIFPVVINYDDDLPEGVGGRACRWKITILPKYMNDNGILAHEKQHVWQWYRTFAFHSLLYNYSKKYRLYAELEAYAVQLKVNKKDNKPDYLDFYAQRITEMYNLDITKQEAKKRLEELTRC